MLDKPLLRLALLACLLAVAGVASALTVSVAPAEGSAYASPPDGTGSPLDFLVSGCLNRLFEAGYIVTDADAIRGSRPDWDASGGAFSGALTGARDGLVDYVIELYVAWKPSSFHKDVLLPAGVAYRLLHAADGRVLLEGEAAGSVDSEDSSSHFESTASQAGDLAARPCVELLATLAMGGEK